MNRAEIKANDWSLTPGRYVGVAPEQEDFDFEETLREIHVALEDLNAEAARLAATIKKNFEELGGMTRCRYRLGRVLVKLGRCARNVTPCDRAHGRSGLSQ